MNYNLLGLADIPYYWKNYLKIKSRGALDEVTINWPPTDHKRTTFERVFRA